jgi:glucuronokinase
MPIDAMLAMVSTTESVDFAVDAADPELHRLLAASAAAFADHHGSLPDVRLSASTEIPRSVGLGGSSALVIASLRALGAWDARKWQRDELAQLALSVERDRLGITAGLQDRLVQVSGELVVMTFDPVTVEVLQVPDDWSFFVAWAPSAADTSDTVHRSIRRRYEAGDSVVHTAMIELAEQAMVAKFAIVNVERERLGEAMNRTFDLRTTMIDVGPAQRRLVEIGQRIGAFVNSAGSGGSIVGLARDADHIAELRHTYKSAGAQFHPMS